VAIASALDLPARGKIIDSGRDSVVFQPAGTTYELHLKTDEPYTGAKHVPVEGIIRVTGRKIYTVPSGGSFIAPIFGPPRTIQGRVEAVNEQMVVVRAAASAPVSVELPPSDTAIDLTEGAIRVGHMINVTALPGATFHLVGQPAAQSESQPAARR
jgi:hypothetical protein